MIVIADTSPLNYLLLIGEAGVLPQLFGKIIIPLAVATEMQNPRRNAILDGWNADSGHGPVIGWEPRE